MLFHLTPVPQNYSDAVSFVVISAADGYEEATGQIEEFINRMMRNPVILYGEPLLPGDIEAMFITE